MPRVMSQGRMEEESVSWERVIVVTGEDHGGVVEKEDEKDEMNIEDLEEVKKDL